ncbi:MAG: DUF2163 domain-containing protein [Aestuariivirga sp.]|uniref:DUF2163 domain-containing protein n=1 Tax=Aestuariivirga sp. TaxID=2650926 RepID=UPI0025C42064|nr:DUF2163 domain-containing protein [Aestuariivirga sp.]MCA3561821.1 DUF2163 domain-containing protein [Aestuariivirga sp.]
MKTLPSSLTAHLAGGFTTLCRCWRVDRRDGVVMGFTDFDRDLAFDGVTYRAASGFTASAIEGQLGLAVSNLDVQGALSADALTEEDLHAGRYDDAAVTIYLVNWSDVAQRAILRAGHLGQVSRGKLAFSAELRGLAARLDQPAGRVFQRSCAWDLGDARCGVDLNAPGRRALGAVSQVIDAFEFTASGLGGLAAGALNRGRLVWTSGGNAGLAVEIKAHAASGGLARIALVLPMGAPVAAGDGFAATVGCDCSFSTCRDSFGNTLNFGGFPHMPGTDFAISYPNQGAGNDGGRIE